MVGWFLHDLDQTVKNANNGINEQFVAEQWSCEFIFKSFCSQGEIIGALLPFFKNFTVLNKKYQTPQDTKSRGTKYNQIRAKYSTALIVYMMMHDVH